MYKYIVLLLLAFNILHDNIVFYYYFFFKLQALTKITFFVYELRNIILCRAMRYSA